MFIADITGQPHDFCYFTSFSTAYVRGILVSALAVSLVQVWLLTKFEALHTHTSDHESNRDTVFTPKTAAQSVIPSCDRSKAAGHTCRDIVSPDASIAKKLAETSCLAYTMSPRACPNKALSIRLR